jgi:mono/diheme cytochrome c family protein
MATTAVLPLATPRSGLSGRAINSQVGQPDTSNNCARFARFVPFIRNEALIKATDVLRSPSHPVRGVRSDKDAMVEPFLLLTFACVPRARRWGLERLSLSHSVALAMLCVAGCEDRCQAQSKEASSTPAETAKALYQQLCRRCHAADGKGDPATEGVPDFTRKAWQQQKSDAELMVTILEGKGTSMPTFRDRISRAQAKVLASYVRAFAPTEPGIQQVTSPDSREFQVQFQQLQKDFEGLQRQLKELTGGKRPGQTTPRSCSRGDGSGGDKRFLARCPCALSPSLPALPR